MIKGFISETARLTDYERTCILPQVCKILSTCRGKSRAVTNKQVCRALRTGGNPVDPPRLRKVINRIRIDSLVENLVATSDGYYVAQTREEMEAYIESLKGREKSIHAVRISLTGQLERNFPARTGDLFNQE